MSNELQMTQSVPRAQKLTLGWVVLVAGTLALGGWIALRVRSAVQTQKAAAEESARSVAAASQKKSAPAQVALARAEQYQPSITLDGTLKPEHEADLGFKISGQLRAVKVKLGDRVRAGQVLATLAATEAESQLEAARAAVRANEAQLAMADDSAHRTGQLVDTGAASPAEGTHTTGQRALAAAQVDAAKAQVALAETTLRNHVLTAPFAGTVTQVPSGVGMIVNPGVALFHLQDTATLHLRGTVGEADAPLIKPGATVQLRASAQEGTRKVEGCICAVLSSVDAATRRVPVEAELKNEGTPPLFAGAFARAEVVGLKPVKVVRLPASALRPGSQNEVLVVNNSRLSTRHISFFIADDGALLVRSGVDAGERVLLSPSAEAHDGDLVTIGEASAVNEARP